MAELADFIGKFKRLHEAGKEANLVLNTLAGSAWATLSVRIRPEGPGQQTHRHKARGARNGPAQQKRREKRASARATATAGAAAADVNEDVTATVTATATAKEGPTERVDKTAESYAEKARGSAAEMRSGEGSKAGMSAMTTSASTKPSKVAGMESCEGSTGMSARTTTAASTKSSKPSNTNGTALHIAAKAVVQTQTKTDLELTLSGQQPVANIELKTDRPRSADAKAKIVDCAVQVAVTTANKSVNTNQDFAYSRNEKQTQATICSRDYSRLTDDDERNLMHCLSDEDEAKFVRDGTEYGWFMLDTPANCMKPNRNATYITRQIILAKISADRVDRYMWEQRWVAYANYAYTLQTRLSDVFRLTGNSVCNDYYSKDSHGRLIHTEQDEVTEVTTEKELEDRLHCCISYAEDFVRELGAKRTLNFE